MCNPKVFFFTELNIKYYFIIVMEKLHLQFERLSKSNICNIHISHIIYKYELSLFM